MNSKSYIIGIGGIFFHSKNPKRLQDWYSDKLGFTPQVPFSENDDAITFHWKTKDDEDQCTVWAPFRKATSYFDPSDKEWMINYIVSDLKGLLAELSKDGIEPVEEIKEYDYGKFVSILDPEGNKIEFWEPNKAFFSNKFQ